DYIRREFEDKKRILDIGCGIGSFEERLPDLDIIGLDLDDEMLYLAKNRTDGAFIRADATRLPFTNSSFDGAFCVTSLEFIEDYKRAVDEAVRVLKPNSNLVVMILNPESGYFKSRSQKEGSYFRRMKHRNLREIRDYLAKFFQVEEHYFLGIYGERVFDTEGRRYASLFVIKGAKK
ncbi:MAG: class I SAM-dependent methyltransferase, partial [archaeon]|nr:class I SAM-dependent methyltransferase [archaeon]